MEGGASDGFGGYLTKYLQDRPGLSKAELARRIGVNQSTVTRWMSGQSQPSTDSLNRIAQRLNVPDTDLLIAAGHLATSNGGQVVPPAPMGDLLRSDEARLIASLVDMADPRRRQELLRIVRAVLQEVDPNG